MCSSPRGPRGVSPYEFLGHTGQLVLSHISMALENSDGVRLLFLGGMSPRARGLQAHSPSRHQTQAPAPRCRRRRGGGEEKQVPSARRAGARCSSSLRIRTSQLTPLFYTSFHRSTGDCVLSPWHLGQSGCPCAWTRSLGLLCSLPGNQVTRTRF